jgi:cell division protein FtsN
MKIIKMQNTRQTRRQQGGTLVGVIIGLIVGLAIAVVVALVITKGSSPFTNKLGKTEKAAETSASQTGDPNKPLYSGKEAAKEAAKEFVKEAEPAKTADSATDTAKAEPKPTPEAVQAAKTDAKAEAKTKSDAKADADKTAAATKPAEVKDAAAKADNADEKWTYYLQAGAFREQADAESTRARLALLGFEASVSERSSDNGVLYRVRVGPFNQVDAMNRVRGKLSENGVDVAVVRNQK